MEKHRNRNLWLLGITAVTLLALFFIGGDLSGSNNQALQTLLAPAFVNQASAAVSSNEAVAKIQDEAGMSAYFKSSTAISISSVKSEFETIEIETADYILGTVPLSGYPEDHTPHVYIHKDGWFLAYYFSDDPSGKIIDWNAYTASGDTVISTKLENILGSVAGAAGVGLNDITHYDFRYPNATTMMFIVERSEGTGNNYFNINIPSSFGVAERSWSANLLGCCGDKIFLNDVNLGASAGNSFDIIAASNMAPNTPHKFLVGYGIDDVAGLVLIYTE